MARTPALKPSEAAEQMINVPVSEIVGLKDELTRILSHLHTGLLTLQNAAADSIRVAQMAPTRVLAGAGVSVGNMTLTPLQPAINSLASITAAAAAPEVIVIDAKSKKQKREKKQKDPFAPARPVTAYFLFLKENRADIKAELGADAAPGQVQARATEKWKDLPENEKEKYKVKYKENWTKYEKALEKYKAQGGLLGSAADAAALTALVDSEIGSGFEIVTDVHPPAPASKKKETKKAGPKGGAAGTPAKAAGTPAKSPELKKKKAAAAVEDNKKKRKSTDTAPEKSKKKKKSEI